MSMGRASVPKMTGVIHTPEGDVDVVVEAVYPHRLKVQLASPPTAFPVEARGATLHAGRRTFDLGRCRVEATQEGHSLIFVEQLYDFSKLASKGVLTDLSARTRQLPLLWKHKKKITPAFRELISDLAFDLQCLRDMYQEIDRNLVNEPSPIRESIQRTVCQHEQERFFGLMNKGLEELKSVSQAFDRAEHESHGFFLRRQLHDMIYSAPILWRTNVRPRGYAGDSTMMRMLYEEDFEGDTIFGQLLHKHVTQTAAAQAVRNRRKLIPGVIDAIRSNVPASRPENELCRVFSVACGPSWEIHDLVKGASDSGLYHFTLLDQDAEALQEAENNLTRVQAETGATLWYQLLRHSVRTMLRNPLATEWGPFDCIYSMGLFDYLTAPVARAVLTKLYSLLRPGGQMVIGNFHTDNPTRIYMEYWMDWVLFYRTEADFLALAQNLPHAECSISFEDTRSQMFLHLRKPEHAPS